MNVLLVNRSCNAGGVGTFLLSMRQALLARGHSVRMFFFSGGTLERQLPADGTAQFGTLADCLRIVDQHRIDVVHGNIVDWETGIAAVRCLGPRLIVTAHKARSPVWAYGWKATNCDRIVAVGDAIAAALRPHTDAPISVVHNGVDSRSFRPCADPRAGRPIVAWVGRSGDTQKRLDRFAAVASLLHAAGARIWVIDAHGKHRASTRYPAAAQAVAGYAEVWRSWPFREMPHVYQAVASSGGCVLSTSDFEGLPLALLEAQACGCVVIAPATCGVDECVAAEHGGVLYPLDVPQADVASLVLRTIGNRDRLTAMGNAAAAFVGTHFTQRRMVESYVQIYQAPPATPTRVVFWRRWSGYTEWQWNAGYQQYVASVTLAGTAQWRLAAHVGRASLATSPTLYMRPSRLQHLVRIHARSRHP